MMTFWKIFSRPDASLRAERSNLEITSSSVLVMTIILSFLASFSLAQEQDSTSFNDQREHGISLGFSITSFNANLTYQVSPAYHYRIGRHQVMVNPFIGRLEEIRGQFDFGLGLLYRIYPAKNLRHTKMFIQAGADYVFQQNSSFWAQSLLYKLGPGVEVRPIDRLSVGINIDVGLLQRLQNEVTDTEVEVPDGGVDLQVKILPFLRLAYLISLSD